MHERPQGDNQTVALFCVIRLKGDLGQSRHLMERERQNLEGEPDQSADLVQRYAFNGALAERRRLDSVLGLSLPFTATRGALPLLGASGRKYGDQ